MIISKKVCGIDIPPMMNDKNENQEKIKRILKKIEYKTFLHLLPFFQCFDKANQSF